MAEPPEIIDLIGRFREHEAAYMAAAYNETSLRDDFLDPFFAALGWDLNNSSGYAQAYRDVIKEESLRTSEGVKAPDFTFRIGGVRKFFVEAKRPSTLQGAIKRSGVYAALCNLFVAADAKYNSGIFHFRKEKGRDEAPIRFR